MNATNNKRSGFTLVEIMIVVGIIGLLAAIYLSEYASPRMRAFAKPTLELLAGIPTVVYGYFALLFVTPLLQQLLPGPARMLGEAGFVVDGEDAFGAHGVSWLCAGLTRPFAT